MEDFSLQGKVALITGGHAALGPLLRKPTRRPVPMLSYCKNSASTNLACHHHFLVRVPEIGCGR